MVTALVAGATGTLGSRIAHALTALPDTEVRLLVRPGWEADPGRHDRIAPLVERGAEVVVGDVTAPQTLATATAGVDVVVSALQGGHDIIIDGQVALAQAAVANGVPRFIPSDFAIDLFHAPVGAPQFEIRKQADTAIDAMPLQVVHVLNGAFMDMMFNPQFAGIVDVDQGVVRHWGTGDEPFDVATVEDTARFTARLAIDPDVAAGVYGISGGPATYRGIARVLSDVTGRPVHTQALGDEAALREKIDAHNDPWEGLYDWYSFAMLATPTLAHPDNDRYPDALPESVDDFLRSTYANPGD